MLTDRGGGAGVGPGRGVLLGSRGRGEGDGLGGFRLSLQTSLHPLWLATLVRRGLEGRVRRSPGWRRVGPALWLRLGILPQRGREKEEGKEEEEGRDLLGF